MYSGLYLLNKMMEQSDTLYECSYIKIMDQCKLTLLHCDKCPSNYVACIQHYPNYSKVACTLDIDNNLHIQKLN